MPLHPLAVVTVVLFLFILPNLICYSHTARWLSLSLSLWPLLCFHSFVSHSQQQSGSSFDMSWCQCVHVSPHHLLSWFLLSFPVSVYNPFIELSRVYKCALIYAELMPKKTQVLFLFHYWGFCQTKNTEGKQEKSVLLFRSKSQGKRDRKQHKGGYDDIFHCDIVNCCSCVLNKLNHHHYLVAGVLHFLYTLRESWEQQDSLVGQEIQYINLRALSLRGFKFVFLVLSSSCVIMEASAIVSHCTDYLEVMVCEKCGGGRTIRDSQLCCIFPAVGHSSQPICADRKSSTHVCRPCWRQLDLKNQCSKNQYRHLPPLFLSLVAFYLIWI